MTRTTATQSRGAALVERLNRGRQMVERAPRQGTRQIPVLTGITQQCDYIEPFSNVVQRAGEILGDSGRVYIHGNSIVMERESNNDRLLIPLTTMCHPEPNAFSVLANTFICEIAARGATSPVQFAPPARFVAVLLNSDLIPGMLPRIIYYATRPVFDENFCFRGPGWHPESQLLVHGPDVEPQLPAGLPTSGPVINRLPPRLRELLSDFCLSSDADVANTVAILLTGLLLTHFVESGKPVCLLDGNQPGVGKTLLARVIGMVLDGSGPRLMTYTTNEEELTKVICATLRSNRQSAIIIDNAKIPAGTVVSSPTIEANSMAPEISLRILGQSANFERPNDLLWFLTMNQTQTSRDLVSRGLPIRFYFAGDPGNRSFDSRDPMAFAREHRTELLGELAGMVIRWIQCGRPPGSANHRCTRWAEIMGGIMLANNIPEFLTNSDEALAEFDTSVGELSALAESAVQWGDGYVRFSQSPATEDSPPPTTGQPEAGCTAANWLPVFVQASVLDNLAGTSPRQAATRIGRFFSEHIGREVPIETADWFGHATLRVAEVRSRRKLYWFDVRPEATAGGDEESPDTSADVRRDRAINDVSAPAEADVTPPQSGTPGSGNQEEW